MHTQFRARGAFPRIIVNGIHSRHNRTCLPASFCSVECACKASFGRLKVMAEHKPIRLILLLTLTLGLNACSVFGAASPTPFTFPTPNLTHTAIFASTPSETPLVPTVPPIQASATPVVALATSTVLSGAPTSTQVAVSPTPTASLPPGTTDTRPNGVPVTAVFLTSPVSIDGDLNEWSSTSYIANQALSYANAGWSGASDPSATYYLAWDADFLYLGVQRIDDTFVQVSTGRYMYRGDDVEIQLDVDLPGDYSSITLSGDDYQIGLSPGNFGTLPPEAHLWFPRSLEKNLTSVVVKATKSNGGYQLEAKIPWSTFGISPESGDRFGFALSLSDNDSPGVSTWQSMVSSVTTRRVANPTTWGTLILGS
jgi:hypothetical protein